MKEASGELSMTLIVIVAAGVILSLFMLFREPILNAIGSKWSEWTGSDMNVDLNDAMIVKDIEF